MELTERQRRISRLTIPAKGWHTKRSWSPLALRFQGDLGGLTMYRSKRGRPVLFVKTHPSGPPTPLKASRQKKFALAVAGWLDLSALGRLLFGQAARRCSLRISGFNLFIAVQLADDKKFLEAVERQAGIQLQNLCHVP